MHFYIKDNIFSDFTFNGISVYAYTSGGRRPYMFCQSAGTTWIMSLWYRISTAQARGGVSSFTGEVQIVRNNTVIATSGEENASRIAGVDYYDYQLGAFGPDNPYHDLSLFTVRVIIRINGSVAKTVDLPMISLPRNVSQNGYVLSLSSPSSPQTGKVGTMSIQRSTSSTSFAKVYAIGSQVLGYRQSNGVYQFQGCGYVSNGTVPVVSNSASTYYYYGDYLTSFSCNYYIPYDTSLTHANNNSSFRIYLFPDITPIQSHFITAQSTLWISYPDDFAIYDSSISLSYVNQSDSNAAPTIGNVSIAESPAGISTTYGRYIGGGISTLTFAYSNVSYKYGASFKEVTYKLYDSSSQLIGTWTSQTEANLSYTLENDADTTYYLDVEIESTANSKGTYRYSNILTYGYSPPYIVSFNASRCNQDGTPNDSGAYCKITYQFRVIALGNHNSKEVMLTAPDGSHVYTNLDYDHGSPYQYISAADIEHSYLLTITIEDDFVTVSASRNLSTAGVIMDFLYDGKGIGLGKVAETTQMVEVNPDWTFKADKITFKGENLESILTSLGYVFPT